MREALLRRTVKQSFTGVRSQAELRNERLKARTFAERKATMWATGSVCSAYPTNRLQIRAMFWPPKPKLLESAASQRASRAALGT